MTYKEQLVDARWQKKKLSILERDGYKCQICGNSSHLSVHHKVYKPNMLAWEYPDNMLVTLCQDCHDKEHNIAPIPKKGNFYTYYHGAYKNDMLCHYISNNDSVYLFGIDNGAFGTPYHEIISRELFMRLYSHSDFIIRCQEQNDTYSLDSFILAYKEIMQNPNMYICNQYPYTPRYHADFIIKSLSMAIKNNVFLSQLIKD